MSIIRAEVKDWDRILEIYNQAIMRGRSTADTELLTYNDKLSWFQEHSEFKYPIFVYSKNHKIVGWCSLSPYRKGRKALSETAEISYYIDNEYQRKGIGTKLVNYAIAKAPELGIKNLFAILLDVNDKSVGLLEKTGFTKWGHLPNIANFESFTCGQYIYGINLIVCE